MVIRHRRSLGSREAGLLTWRGCTFTLEDRMLDASPAACSQQYSPSPTGQETAPMCDDRGRVQGLRPLLHRYNRFEGVLEGVTAEWFEQRYEMYIVFDDDDGLRRCPWVLSLQGPAANQILNKAELPEPEAGHHLLSDSGVRVAEKTELDSVGSIFSSRLNSSIGANRFRRRSDMDGAHCRSLAHLGAKQDGRRWRRQNDGSGHRGGMQLQQGCYLGQEVINRIDVKGQVNKRLSLIVTNGQSPIQIGSTVFLEGSKIGKVSSATRSDGRVWLWQFVENRMEPGTEVEVDTPNGTVNGSVAG